MTDELQTDVIYGPLDESEEAVAAVNALAEKHDDPDMQVDQIHLSIDNFNFNHVRIICRCLKMFMFN